MTWRPNCRGCFLVLVDIRCSNWDPSGSSTRKKGSLFGRRLANEVPVDSTSKVMPNLAPCDLKAEAVVSGSAGGKGTTYKRGKGSEVFFWGGGHCPKPLCATTLTACRCICMSMYMQHPHTDAYACHVHGHVLPADAHACLRRWACAACRCTCMSTYMDMCCLQMHVLKLRVAHETLKDDNVLTTLCETTTQRTQVRLHLGQDLGWWVWASEWASARITVRHTGVSEAARGFQGLQRSRATV